MPAKRLAPFYVIALTSNKPNKELKLYIKNMVCGRCILAVCSHGPTCPRGPAAAQPLMVVDSCGSCGPDDLLVDPGTFRWVLCGRI